MGRKLTNLEIRMKIKEKLGNKYRVLTVKGMITKGGTVTIKCLKHNSVNTVSLLGLIGSKKSCGKSGCRACKNENIRKGKTTNKLGVTKILSEKLPKNYVVKKSPEGLTGKAEIYCIKHELTYTKTVHVLLKAKNFGCPKCFNQGAH